MKKLILTNVLIATIGGGVVLGSSLNSVKVMESPAAEMAEPGDKVKVYPNPADSYILLKADSESEFVRVEIHNIFGRKVMSFTSEQGAIVQRFDINELPKGVYMVRGIDSNNRVVFTKTVSKR